MAIVKLVPIDYDQLVVTARAADDKLKEQDRQFAAVDNVTLRANLQRAARHIGVDGCLVENLTPQEQVYANFLKKQGTLTAAEDGRTGIMEPFWAIEEQSAPPAPLQLGQQFSGAVPPPSTPPPPAEVKP